MLTLEPMTPGVLLPPLSRPCRKLDRNDWSAVVELDAVPLEELPPKSPISFSNAVLSVDRVLDDRLEEEVALISWLLPNSVTRALSAEMMSCCPYEDAAVLLAVDAAGAETAGVVVADAVPLDAVAAAAVAAAAVAAAAAALAAVTGVVVAAVEVLEPVESSLVVDGCVGAPSATRRPCEPPCEPPCELRV